MENSKVQIGNSIFKDWKASTLADAYKERPPLEYLVGQMIEFPSLSIVYGSPGTFKSFLLADLAVCVANGCRWLSSPSDDNGKSLRVTQGPVVWIDYDNGKRRSDDRFAALGRAHNLPHNAPLHYFSMTDPNLDASNRAHVDELISIIKKYKAKLLVIDNLAAISGRVDENSADMGQVLRNLRLLVEQTGIACIVIHHRRKNNRTSSRIGDSLRGHNSVEAVLDYAILIERGSNSPVVTISFTKARGEVVKPFSAHFHFEQDKRGQLDKALFTSTATTIFRTNKAVMQEIWSNLDGGNKPKTTLIHEVYDSLKSRGDKTSNATINDTIVAMHAAGHLIMTPGDNNSQLYSKKPGAQLPA